VLLRADLHGHFRAFFRFCFRAFFRNFVALSFGR
jgi:hypothetical protein